MALIKVLAYSENNFFLKTQKMQTVSRTTFQSNNPIISIPLALLPINVELILCQVHSRDTFKFQSLN